jgi:hypothetical protein
MTIFAVKTSSEKKRIFFNQRSCTYRKMLTFADLKISEINVEYYVL